MQKRRGDDEDLDHFDRLLRLEEAFHHVDAAVGEAHEHVRDEDRHGARGKEGPQELGRLLLPFDEVVVVDPDDGEVLDVVENGKGRVANDEVVDVDPAVIDDKHRSRHHRDLGQADLLTGDRPPDDVGQVGREHGHSNVEQPLFEQERPLGRQKGHADSLVVV